MIDSHFTDQSLAFLVETAAELANKGADAETILAAIEKGQKNSLLYIGVANLNNLVKGGRISRATGVLSNVFNIRVVMQLLDTGLETMSKGRGNKAFNRWFDELKKDKLSKLSNVKKIGISHAAGLETAMKFKEELQEMFPNIHIPVLDTSPIIATHTGEGAFAIMFYLE